jgi:hypothetical protein
MTSHLNKHLKQYAATKKKQHNLNQLRDKATRLRQALPKGSCLGTITPDSAPKNQHIGSPESVLSLVFQFLDIYELLKPVCKLWTILVMESNWLWNQLYCYHFGKPSKEWMLLKSPCDWKASFRSMHQANRGVNNDANALGWKIRVCPVLGCCNILGTKLEFDLHMAKHEVKQLFHASKLKPTRLL